MSKKTITFRRASAIRLKGKQALTGNETAEHRHIKAMLTKVESFLNRRDVDSEQKKVLTQLIKLLGKTDRLITVYNSLSEKPRQTVT